ncbi:DUF262 domain-containing protein [Deinococcus detaillensis]|uniref:DUF262 domain-containing protein n=1 Tax=Deinococcus detaillensis TaxID=2592048 RepID=A0A553UIE8_9DEIO|nr:DUF262 and DUF1524 domain-containing protein [Deinococcus detaillensis]TSA79963.1 DUF262 domain-containing protein [Deinococcus detaillensis]
MKAGEVRLMSMLAGADQQFVIPLYQRRYSWKDKQRWQLWRDILRAAAAPDSRPHFTGPVVQTKPDTEMGEGQLRSSRLIDGQQRVTTVILLLEMLAKHLKSKPLDAQKLGYTEDDVRNKYLFNPAQTGNDLYKLTLSHSDQATLKHVLSGTEKPAMVAEEVIRGAEFFRERFAEPGVDVAAVWRGLNRLEVVRITLTEGIDDLGSIFESLNSTGKALTQADLVRNNVLMGLTESEQRDLSQDFWQKLERRFAQVEEDAFDRFLRDFLTLRTRSLPNEGDVYAVFKEYRQGQPKDQHIRVLAADLERLSRAYVFMLNPELSESVVETPLAKSSEIKQALLDLAGLRVRVVAPFVLELLEDRGRGFLKSDAELIAALRVVESFLVRRAVTGERSSPLNRLFATLGRDLRKENDYVRSLEEALVRFQDGNHDGFPSDEAFLQQLQVVPLYKKAVCKALLMSLERSRNTEEKFGGVLTIEHILPQNSNLSAPWRKALGEDDWREIQTRLVHTLGNLTLTAYNSELGDRSFEDKKTLPIKAGDTEESAQPKGYKFSRLVLTHELCDKSEWNATEIEARGQRLAKAALTLFPFPKFEAAEMAQLRKEGRERDKTPTVERHLESSSVTLKQLFKTVQDQLLGFGVEMDVSITQVPLKEYVAYKAGTNFCDVQPLPAHNTLKCWLHLPPEKLAEHDPTGLGRDVSGNGRPSSGKVEVVVGESTDLEAFGALVRQALEHQLARQSTSASAGTSQAVEGEIGGENIQAYIAALTMERQQAIAALEQALIGLDARLVPSPTRYYVGYGPRPMLMSGSVREGAYRLTLNPVAPDELPADLKAGWTEGSGEVMTFTVHAAQDAQAALPLIGAVLAQRDQGQRYFEPEVRKLRQLIRQEVPVLGPELRVEEHSGLDRIFLGDQDFARVWYNRGDLSVAVRRAYSEFQDLQGFGRQNEGGALSGWMPDNFIVKLTSAGQAPQLLAVLRQACKAARA